MAGSHFVAVGKPVQAVIWMEAEDGEPSFVFYRDIVAWEIRQEKDGQPVAVPVFVELFAWGEWGVIQSDGSVVRPEQDDFDSVEAFAAAMDGNHLAASAV